MSITNTAVATITTLHTIPRLLDQAEQRLKSAHTAAEVLEAQAVAAAAYDQAQLLAKHYAGPREAYDDLMEKVRRVRGDALQIEARADCLLHTEYSAAVERKEVAGHGGARNFKVPGRNVEPSAADLGLTRKQTHKARLMSKAEKLDQGFVRRKVESCIANGEDPTRTMIMKEATAIVSRSEAKNPLGGSGQTTASCGAAVKAPAPAGQPITVPRGSTVESQARKGLDAERRGETIERASELSGIGVETYRRVRELIVLLDEIELEPEDRAVIANAIASINADRRLAPHAAAEPIVRRVWGTGKQPHNARSARERAGYFDRVMAEVTATCAGLGNFDIPYLKHSDAEKLAGALAEARTDLDRFLRRLKVSAGIISEQAIDRYLGQVQPFAREFAARHGKITGDDIIAHMKPPEGLTIDRVFGDETVWWHMEDDYVKSKRRKRKGGLIRVWRLVNEKETRDADQDK